MRDIWKIKRVLRRVDSELWESAAGATDGSLSKSQWRDRFLPHVVQDTKDGEELREILYTIHRGHKDEK